MNIQQKDILIVIKDFNTKIKNTENDNQIGNIFCKHGLDKRRRRGLHRQPNDHYEYSLQTPSSPFYAMDITIRPTQKPDTIQEGEHQLPTLGALYAFDHKLLKSSFTIKLKTVNFTKPN